ncbi:MAG: 3TM-type holin [Rhodoferax sp.]
MSDLIQLAPAILGFLGGPAGGLAGAGLQWLAGKLGATDTTVGAIKSALDGLTPADTIKLRQMDVDFQQFCMENAIKVDMAQIGVNTEEAKSTSLFVAGWRPFVGWTCGTALAYVAIMEPIARFVATMAGYSGAFPAIDTTLTMQVLIGLLGLGTLRSYDKKQGTAQ